MDTSTTRLLILDRLNQAFPYAVTVPLLRAQLKHAGCDIENSEVLGHLRALADSHALVDVDRDPLDEEIRRWRITEKGRGYLKAQG